MTEQDTIDRINAEMQSPEAISDIPFRDYLDSVISNSKKLKQIEYNEKYIANHKDYLKQNITCLVCGNTYQRWNRSNHEKIKKHKEAVYLIRDIPDYTDET